MNASTALIIANVAVWLGIAGYLAYLGASSARLSRRLQQLEMLSHDHAAD